jgi:hypothetical protein
MTKNEIETDNMPVRIVENETKKVTFIRVAYIVLRFLLNYHEPDPASLTSPVCEIHGGCKHPIQIDLTPQLYALRRRNVPPKK